jgi:hypothetical protein
LDWTDMLYHYNFRTIHDPAKYDRHTGCHRVILRDDGGDRSEGLEGWMDRLIAASGYEGAVIVASDATQKRLAEENGKQILDPMLGTTPPTASSMFKTSSKLYRTPTLQVPRNTRPTASGMQTSWARSMLMPAMQ